MSRIDSPNPFRVQGEVISIAELAKTKPGLIVAADDPRVAPFQERMAEIQAVLKREYPEEFAPRRAEANPGQIYEPTTAAAQPEVTGAGQKQTFSSLEWELARSRMTFDTLLKK
ncbi:hypothetical protein NHH82_18210 [Oxalobacteraceae bacterium OTU3REALA1]|nr:hypothetical protein NHH82_18210 [Oxalobacteraceae bacterium OTU3REALA1]